MNYFSQQLCNKQTLIESFLGVISASEIRDHRRYHHHGDYQDHHNYNNGKI